MKQIHCIYCNKSFAVRNNGRNRRYKNDLWMCNSCDTFQWIIQMQGKFYKDYCIYCDFWAEYLINYHPQCTCACINQLGLGILKQGYDMLYCHYELFTLNTVLAGTNIPTSLNMMKLKFSSSSSNGAAVNFNRDGTKLKEIVQIIKQIPAGKRSYDAITNIWVIPASHFNIIAAIVGTQPGLAHANPPNYGVMIQHPDLDIFLNPPQPESKNSWSNVKVKTEKPEDFFYKPTTEMPVADIKTKLIAIVQPFMPMPLDELDCNKEWMMRAYKITARKLHPDLGGDAAKMSELNSLYMQYKKIVEK